MAGELASWRFDQTENSLEFTTDEGVQPRAQLVPDPTRLVIDLPGTSIGAVQQSQLLSGAFRQVRIGQLDVNTARIVVELAPGYMLDPQQVQFRGISPTQWTVQLPSPQYTGSVSSSAVESNSSSNSNSPEPASSFANSPMSHSSAGYSSTATPSSTAAPAVTTLPPTVAPAPRSPSASVNPSIGNLTNPLSNFSTTSSTNTPTNTPTNAPTNTSTNTSTNPSASASSSPTVIDDSVTQIEEMQITDDGLFLRTVGATPEIDDVDRSRDRRSITVTIENAILSPALMQDRAIEQFGVEQIAFKQILDDDNDPPAVEITLEVERDSPNWDATVSGLGGVVLLPHERMARRSNSRNSDSHNSDADSRNSEMRPVSQDTRLAESPTPSQTLSDPPVAMIEGIDLDPSGSQLLIHSDRPIAYSGRWQSGMYQVRLSPAQLAEQVTGPQLDSSSPLLRVRLRQEDDETVLVMIQPASGVRFGTLNSVSPQLLSLEMERSTATAVPASSTSTNQTIQQNSSTSSFSASGLSGSRIPNGQIVVVIDPGHGGADVGAVGVNDIYEADVVLPIAQQVGALLQQQGIQVVMTRNDDREIDLEPRVQMAEQANATLFVSIHANSMGMDRPDVNGTETYYYSSGEGLAQVIQDNIISAVGTNDRGIKQARFYVLRRTTMPAVLVETGYVTGSEDGPLLADNNFRLRMAQGIAQGILQYIRSVASHLTGR